ncbi:MAG: GntR family transcriptional regulator [Alicyclobacillus sp.]|nr:GntR family transcriptional regulator [Alicyclobacillus sp.]
MDARRIGTLTFHLDLSQPLYEQILRQMRQAIAKGEMAPGDKIPSVRELAQGLRVNPNTVSHAYQELERDGLTETRRGQGTYVTTSADRVQQFRDEWARNMTRDFLDSMHAHGFSWMDIQRFLREVKEGLEDA